MPGRATPRRAAGRPGPSRDVLGRIDLVALLEALMRQIPAGKVGTYGDLAAALGDRVAARWVGTFAREHVHDAACPCHRIVRADGQLGLYIDGSTSHKARRLRDEGVVVQGDRVDLARFRFDRFVSDRPLETLRRMQEDLVRQALLRRRRRMPRRVGGVDVSYTRSGEGVAAYVLVDVQSQRVVWSTTIRRPVTFPYITGYLAFRELPILLALFETVRAAGQECNVLLVDGSGMLHPRHAGIATHLGVLTAQPTIGVTKKLLHGRVDVGGMRPRESRDVMVDDAPLGVAVRPTAGSLRPIFVSPGHRVDVDFAGAVVLALLTGRRLPEPLYWADRLSRQTARGETMSH